MTVAIQTSPKKVYFSRMSRWIRRIKEEKGKNDALSTTDNGQKRFFFTYILYFYILIAIMGAVTVFL